MDLDQQMDSGTLDNQGNATMPDEGFPMSVIVTGFFVTSLAYLVCFCCCVVQFFLRRRQNTARGQTGGTATGVCAAPIQQKNDTLKKRFMMQFRNSLRKFKKSRAPLPAITCSTRGPCSICLVEYTENPAEIFIGYIKGCGHFFHFECIWTWLESKGNCPLCRHKVYLKEDDVRGVSLKHVIKELDGNPPMTPEHSWVSVITMENDATRGSDGGNSSSSENTPDGTTPSTTVTVEVDNPAFEADDTVDNPQGSDHTDNGSNTPV